MMLVATPHSPGTQTAIPIKGQHDMHGNPTVTGYNSIHQLSLPIPERQASDDEVLPKPTSKREALNKLLAGDLDFRGLDSGYASHNFHAFAAKFPPQLPRLFIQELTRPGEFVLDPMMGSGTTVLEAYLLGRLGVGCDLDPLAVRQARVKTTPVDVTLLREIANQVIAEAQATLANPTHIDAAITHRFSQSARAFLDYWFLPHTQRELMALLLSIEKVAIPDARAFLEIAFSSVIVTKSGGVSRARDLAHSRPHRVLDKIPKNAIDQFAIRVSKNLKSIQLLPDRAFRPVICRGDARSLPFEDGIFDIIITSPPYASAIDYMRAHKFSLVWFGEALDHLSELRARYIGSERVSKPSDRELPNWVEGVVRRIKEADHEKGKILRKYYCEMADAIAEMYRVLKVGGVAVIVVGSSTIRGIDTETHRCLAEIASAVGFDVAPVAERNLDRDKRMMPARLGARKSSVIEQRMHCEYVIAGVKERP